MRKFLKILFTILMFFNILIPFTSEKGWAKMEEITKVKASHILVSSEGEAKALKSEIEEGASFEELAKKYSKCPSGANGGDLGYFRRGQMVKEFENAAFDTEINQVSDPIKTQFGYHLIKVYDKKYGKITKDLILLQVFCVCI